jgi:Ca-activated chloride channel family protein
MSSSTALTFATPWVFMLLLLLPFLWSQKGNKQGSLFYGNLDLLKTLPVSLRLRWSHPILKTVRILVLLLFVTALARPRIAKENTKQEVDALDIMLVVDVSTSMLAEDFTIREKRYNRLDVVKKVVSDFIDERKEDRIGLVMFAGEAMTVCPLTSDYGVLKDFLDTVQARILQDGTAIGEGLAFAVNRLKNSKSKSKVAILLTDGDNNAGQVDPELAADLAATHKIKVYTICAGSDGPVPFPVEYPLVGVRYVPTTFPIDEKLLKTIAQKTKGQYFRATNTEALKNIYAQINQLETTKIEVAKTTEFREIFSIFLIPALLLLSLEVGLSQTFFLRCP